MKKVRFVTCTYDIPTDIKLSVIFSCDYLKKIYFRI